MSDVTNEFDPTCCPVGLTNKLNLEHTEDRLSAMIEHIAEKVTETQKDITSLSKNMDEKFDKVNKRFDDMDEKIEKLKESIPSTIDDELEKKKGTTAKQALKWVFCGMGSTILITVVTAWVKLKLGL